MTSRLTCSQTVHLRAITHDGSKPGQLAGEREYAWRHELLRASRVEVLFCGQVHTGRPVQVVDRIRLYRTQAVGNSAQLAERWTDADTPFGFHRCDVTQDGIQVSLVLGKDQCEEFDSYGPMGILGSRHATTP